MFVWIRGFKDFSLSGFDKLKFVFQRETAEDSGHQEEREGCHSGRSHYLQRTSSSEICVQVLLMIHI